MKIALVTGSSRGIGRAIADLLGKNGYWVVYSGTRPQRPEGLPPGRTTAPAMSPAGMPGGPAEAYPG